MRISDWSSDVCSSDLIVRVVDPGEVVESLDLEVLGHNAQGTRVDIPAGDGDRHIATAFAQFLHDRSRATGIVGHAVVALLEDVPGFLPTIDRIIEIGSANV